MITQIQPGSVKTISGDEGIKNARLQGILRYWHEKRGSRALPSLAQIDPIEIPKFLPIILLANVLPGAITVRLLGTDSTNAYGRETRGRDVNDLNFGEFSRFWREAFALVRASGQPAMAAGSFQNGGMELLDAETVLAPLSDDGTAITHILGGLLIRPAPCRAITLRQAPTGIAAARLTRIAR